MTPTTQPTTTSTRPVPPTTLPPTTVPPKSGPWWTPSTGVVPWQWEIGQAFDVSSATDLGTNDTLPNGAAAPAPQVYDIDGIDNSAATVSALQARGAHVICYMEVGTAGNYGGAYTTYYNELQAAGDLGSQLSGYPEYFININAPSAVAIVESILSQQCAAKGFDAVETDLDETFNNNEGTTGFTITQADEEAYLTTLANYMHGLGMGWIAKNLDDTGSQSFVNDMMNVADGVITEQCNQYSSCSLYKAFEGKKAIFNAEYNLTTAQFCASDDAAGINGALFPVDLNGPRSPCQ